MRRSLKKCIKYVYYKTLCRLLNPKGDDKDPYMKSPLKYWLTGIVPGNKQAAAILTIEGKVSGVGFNKWLRQRSLDLSLNCWVNKRNPETVEAFVIGSPKIVFNLVRSVYKGPKKAIVVDVMQLWFNKPSVSEIKNKTTDYPDELLSGPGQESFIVKNIVQNEYENIKNAVEEVALINENVYHEKIFSTGRLIIAEFKKMGYPANFIKNIVVANVDGKKIYFHQTKTSMASSLGCIILGNKDLAREFFNESGISIAKGKLFSRKQKEQAESFALNLSSAVVKPVDGGKGKGVTVGVKNKREFARAWSAAKKTTKRGILIEEQFIGGIEARYFVIGGKCAAVAKRVPPHVLGNGLDTIEKLLERKNEERSRNPHLRNRLIKVDEHRSLILKEQGYELSSIPSKGVVVVIDKKASFSTGADSVDITDEVHPSFKAVAERAATAVPGIGVVGVDILAFDHLQRAQENNYIVIESNTRPCLGAHHYPVYGKPRNVAKIIVEYSLNKIKT